MATKLSAPQVGAAPFARALWRVLRTRTIDLDPPELKNKRSTTVVHRWETTNLVTTIDY